jgi:hypothetical protein
MDQLQGGKKVPSPSLILRFTRCEEIISRLFNNILLYVLNNPCKTACLLVEDALHVSESERIPELRNCVVTFVAPIKLAIFPDSLPHFKGPKVAGVSVWRIRWVG